MVTIKECCVVLLYALCGVHGATLADKNLISLKRAVENYNYPVPIVTFQENSKKTLIEMIKSVSPPSGQGRYLPPSPTAASNSGPKAPPISVTYNSYEPSASSGQNKPTATEAPPLVPAAPASAPAPSTTNTNVQKKRPSGGLGGFKYYGGSGSSSSSSSSSSDSSSANAAAAAPVATSAPSLAPAPAPAPAPSKSVTIESAPEKPIQKGPGKEQGYNYPSPKSNRKPSKKEQRLADSKPEESAQGYHYDVGPGVLASNFQTFSSGSSGGAMGMSYMKQSSPFYSYHVMLD